MREIITVKNEKLDPIASNMMSKLCERVNVHDEMELVSLAHESVEGAKCDLVTLIQIGSAVGLSLVSALIYDILKGIYSRCRHPKGYEWKLTISSENEENDVTVFSQNGIVEVRIAAHSVEIRKKEEK